jgi:hypothetical protein
MLAHADYYLPSQAVFFCFCLSILGLVEELESRN